MDTVLHDYLHVPNLNNEKLSEIKTRSGNGNLKFLDGIVKNLSSSYIETFESVSIELNYEVIKNIKIYQYRIDIGINNYMGERIAWLSSDVLNDDFNIYDNKIIFSINNLPIAPGDYTLNIYSEINNEVADWLTEVLPFSVIEKDYYKTGKLIPENQGSMLLNFNVK
jgi:lipopolysaccharide transport system ATP-binding protein